MAAKLSRGVRRNSGPAWDIVDARCSQLRRSRGTIVQDSYLLSRLQTQLSGRTPSISLLIWPAHRGFGDAQALTTPDEIITQANSLGCLQPE